MGRFSTSAQLALTFQTALSHNPALGGDTQFPCRTNNRETILFVSDIRQTLLSKRPLRTLAIVGFATVLVCLVAGIAGLLVYGGRTQAKLRDLQVSEVKLTSVRTVASASGRLAASESRLISATSPGRIVQLPVKTGDLLVQGQVVAKLVNPAIVNEETAAVAALSLGVATTERAAVDHQVQIVRSRTALSDAIANAEVAELQAKAEETLAASGVISKLQARKSQLEAETARQRVEDERQSVKLLESLGQQVDAAGRAQVKSLEAALRLAKSQLEGLAIIAPNSGVVEEVLVEIGGELVAGSPVARAYDPTNMVALLDVPERQAARVEESQAVQVQLLGVEVEGEVSNVSPVAKDGAVSIEVKLLDQLPAGARPELRVRADIQMKLSQPVLTVSMPDYVGEAANAKVYVLTGREARLQDVEFGDVQDGQVEVKSGLKSGDVVIVSGIKQMSDIEVLEIQ